jgi:6-phosphogluconolactonase
MGGGAGSPVFDAGPVPASAYVYIAQGSPQITILSLDMSTGKLSPKGTAQAADQSVGYLAFSPDKHFLYALSEADGANSKVYAHKINAADGSLTAINSAITGGDGAPHVAVHPSGKLVMVAHYTSGDVSSLKVDDQGGVVMPPADVQHPFDRYSHQVVFDPSGKFAFVPNIDANTIFQYGVDVATGKLTANGQVAGFPDMAGPRHMALHPSGKYAFVMNELATTVTSLAYDSSTGKLSNPVTIDSLPAGAVRDMNTSGAHILAHPGGRFVFSSNRGHNSISTFAVDASGRLTLTSNETGGGAINMPRDFGMDPSGKFLVVGNLDANDVMVFEISPGDGKLTLRDTKPTPGSPSFVGVIFL